jgi:hypothetical protein
VLGLAALIAVIALAGLLIGPSIAGQFDELGARSRAPDRPAAW